LFSLLLLFFFTSILGPLNENRISSSSSLGWSADANEGFWLVLLFKLYPFTLAFKLFKLFLLLIRSMFLTLGWGKTFVICLKLLVFGRSTVFLIELIYWIPLLTKFELDLTLSRLLAELLCLCLAKLCLSTYFVESFTTELFRNINECLECVT